MQHSTENEPDDALRPFRIVSRRQVVAVLRNLHERKQLLRLLINNGMDAVMTSILDVDEANGEMVIDCAPSAIMNQRILDSENVEFETSLDSIRILFSAPRMHDCMHDGLRAFAMSIPTDMLRMQRREFYRVPTPIASPVRCTVRIAQDGEAAKNLVLVLQNISGGGVALLDDSKQLDNTVGRIYRACKIDLPGSTASVEVDLQIRNSQEISRENGKSTRRLGCLFVDPTVSALAAIQRYITKLEREQNARNNGLA